MSLAIGARDLKKLKRKGEVVIKKSKLLKFVVVMLLIGINSQSQASVRGCAFTVLAGVQESLSSLIWDSPNYNRKFSRADSKAQDSALRNLLENTNPEFINYTWNFTPEAAQGFFQSLNRYLIQGQGWAHLDNLFPANSRGVLKALTKARFTVEGHYDQSFYKEYYDIVVLAISRLSIFEFEEALGAAGKRSGANDLVFNEMFDAKVGDIASRNLNSIADQAFINFFFRHHYVSGDKNSRREEFTNVIAVKDILRRLEFNYSKVGSEAHFKLSLYYIISIIRQNVDVLAEIGETHKGQELGELARTLVEKSESYARIFDRGSETYSYGPGSKYN